MGSVIFLVFIILFVLFLFGLFSRGDGQGNPVARSKRWQRTRPGDGSTRAARTAMQRAGFQGSEAYVSVADIGLLAYRHSDEPKLVRYGDVLLDTQYLRPFVDLWLPYASRGIVRFELVDGEGRLRYADETRYDLNKDRNTLLPGTWLPLRGKSVGPGPWSLRVMAGDALLAVHSFGWQPVGGGQLQRYVADDGEISPSLHQALRAQPREAVSLADLLADQEE